MIPFDWKCESTMDAYVEIIFRPVSPEIQNPAEDQHATTRNKNDCNSRSRVRGILTSEPTSGDMARAIHPTLSIS